MTAVDPCPHILPCGACIDCCERDHDHDQETGARENIGIRQLSGYRQQPEGVTFDADGKRVPRIVLIEEAIEEEFVSLLGKYWQQQSDNLSSPAAEALSRLILQGRDPGIPGFRVTPPDHHGKTVNLPEADG